MWTYEEALEALLQTRKFGKKIGLEPLRLLLHSFGDPQEQIPCIHLAGTNGKGSTAATLTSILAASGYRTGLYTSPYLVRFTERIRILDGPESAQRWRAHPEEGEISRLDTAWALHAVFERAKQLRPQIEQKVQQTWNPTFFELLTAAAWVYFARQNCQVVVLETGLGGRLDSTNVVRKPEAIGITTLGYDHCEYLGETLPAIAGEKAGVFKQQVPIFAVDPREGEAPVQEGRDAASVLLERANEVQAPLYWIRGSRIVREPLGLEGQRLQFPECWETETGAQRAIGCRSVRTPLLGAHQRTNIALACALAELFLESRRDREAGQIPERVETGVEQTLWLARMQVLRTNPPLLLDGAHNAQGGRALAEAYAELFPGQAPVLLCGFLENKDYLALLEPFFEQTLSPRAILVVPPDEPSRALPADEVVAVIRRRWGERVAVSAFAEVEDARLYAERECPGSPLLCFGSLYLAGPCLRAWYNRGD